MEELTLTKILRQVRAGQLDKSSAIEYLITYIEGSENPQIIGKSLREFIQITSRNKRVFKFLENLMVSDESPLVRSIAAEILFNDYPIDSLKPLKWAIQNEKSALFFKNLLSFLEKVGGKVSEELKDEFFQRIGKFYGVYPDEAKIFWDLICNILSHQDDMDLDSDGYKGCGTTKRDIIHGDAFYIERYGHVTALNLAGWKLNILPESIGALSKLRYLDLGRNSISKLPKALLNLSELKELDLSDTTLQRLPEWLGNLPKLRKIDLSNNHLKNIPSWVLEFAKKRYSPKYILDGVVPSESVVLGLLDMLTGWHFDKAERDDQIELNYAQCFKINDEGHIIGIYIAYPEWPRIGIFPEQICDLTFLKELYLINHDLKQIPESITKLENLKILNLDINEIYEIPESIRSFLEILDEFSCKNK